MITVYQTIGRLTCMPFPKPKYIGSFFSIESAEDELGAYFVRNCCEVRDFWSEIFDRT